MKRILAFLAAALVVVSCGKDEVPQTEHSVLIYLAGRNSLAGMVSDCLSQLDRGFLPESGSRDAAVLVYIRNYEENPKLLRLSRGADGKMQKELLFNYPSEQNSSSPETLKRVIEDAENLCPAKKHGLILWSHSSGWLPKEYLNKSSEYEAGTLDEGKGRARQVTSFGKDDIVTVNSEMDIRELATAIPFKYDYIIFDSCLMGCVEVACELKEKCDYIAFSPAEIKSQGFPYYMMMDRLFHSDVRSALTAVCTEYYEYYRKDYEQSPWTSGGTISLVSTAQIDRLAEEFAAIVRNHRDRIYGLQNVQQYFRYDYHWFYDLDDIVEQSASEPEKSAFRNALDEVVLYKAATAGFMLDRGGFLINHYSGLSSFIPRYGKEEKLKEYYKTLKWNKATLLVE